MAKTDVELHVRHEGAAGVTLFYELSASNWDVGPYRRTFRPVSLRREPHEYFQKFLKEIEELSAESERDPWSTEKRFRSRGEKLSKALLPDDLRQTLRDLVDDTETLWIVSDEPWIPWEILRLPTEPGKDDGEGAFFGEAFALSRWRRDRCPRRRFSLSNMALVVTGDAGLPAAHQERQSILGLAAEGRQVKQLPARYREVLEALQGGVHDGWHFACHGSAHSRGSSSWELSFEGCERVTPDDLSDGVRGLRGSHPLVFLNACESAQGGYSLTRLGGWAEWFMASGAGAFIGPMWSIRDTRARAFAEGFYEGFCGGAGIAEAARQARLSLRARFPGDPNRLAYALFAWPRAVCRSAETEVDAATGWSAADDVPVADDMEAPPAKQPEIPQLGMGFLLPSSADSQPGTELVHDKDGSVLVLVPAGTYLLGTECYEVARPVHRVRLSSFWIGKHPVTNRQYARFLDENPDHPRPSHWDEERLRKLCQPVVGVSWYDALAYCRWAGLRLPSEAQWEAAARGRDQRKYPWGGDLPTRRHANFGSEIGAPTDVEAHAEGRGPYGTLGQAGNVWEWCADSWSRMAYADLPTGVLDPLLDGTGAARVVRGGSWQNPAKDMHAAYRDFATAKLGYPDLGFRCALPADKAS